MRSLTHDIFRYSNVTSGWIVFTALFGALMLAALI